MSMTVTTSNYAPRERGRSAERGISLVELVIAITVLAVGMAGLAVLFSTAIMNNSRSKGDTSGTMLTQTVLEKIAAQPANLAANLTVTDCNPAGAVVWPIATTGAASPGAGAAIVGSYKMQYVACGGNGQQTIYDVRWNIQTITANSRLITVSTRPLAATAAGNQNQALLFAPPITLRTIGGL